MGCLVGTLEEGEFGDGFGEERVVVHAEKIDAAVDCVCGVSRGGCGIWRGWTNGTLRPALTRENGLRRVNNPVSNNVEYSSKYQE